MHHIGDGLVVKSLNANEDDMGPICAQLWHNMGPKRADCKACCCDQYLPKMSPRFASAQHGANIGFVNPGWAEHRLFSPKMDPTSTPQRGLSAHSMDLTPLIFYSFGALSPKATQISRNLYTVRYSVSKVCSKRCTCKSKGDFQTRVC